MTSFKQSKMYTFIATKINMTNCVPVIVLNQGIDLPFYDCLITVIPKLTNQNNIPIIYFKSVIIQQFDIKSFALSITYIYNVLKTNKILKGFSCTF